jgi:formylglycine-generating enzyme required for sulfatase activity
VVIRLRARVIVGAAVLACGAAAADACFPDYEVGTAADGGTDGTTADASEGSTADGTSSGGDGETGADGQALADGSGDGNVAHAATPGGETGGGPLVNVASIEAGTFYFQVYTSGGALIDATATTDYTLAVDVDEVSVGRFQAWLDAGMQLPGAGTRLDPSNRYPVMTWDNSWADAGSDTNYGNAALCNTPGDQPADKPTITDGNPSLPMSCVTWEQALAFCWWDKQKRLPTDTEWRIVATSEGRQSPYPWGAGAPSSCSYAIYNDNGTTFCNFPQPVGSAKSGSTLDGVHDIVGSLNEWLWDVQAGNAYAYPADAGNDYPGPPLAGGQNNSRLYIGGDYTVGPTDRLMTVLQAGPTSSSPEEHFNATGWRCAKSF